MYGRIALIVLAATAGALVVHLLAGLVRRREADWRPRPFGLFGKLVYGLLLLSVAALAGTSLYDVNVDGVMAGWLLWAHTSAAGLFILTLVLATLMWAESSRFSYRPEAPTDPPAPRFSPLARMAFWLVLAAGLVSLATMLAAMFPLAGAEGQAALVVIHRWSGLAVVVGAMVHAYCLSLGRVTVK